MPWLVMQMSVTHAPAGDYLHLDRTRVGDVTVYSAPWPKWMLTKVTVITMFLAFIYFLFVCFGFACSFFHPDPDPTACLHTGKHN